MDDFKKIIRDSRLMTPKEKNLLIRSHAESSVKYSDFPDMLYKVRFEISSSRLMETGIGQLSDELLMAFRKYEI